MPKKAPFPELEFIRGFSLPPVLAPALADILEVAIEAWHCPRVWERLSGFEIASASGHLGGTVHIYFLVLVFCENDRNNGRAGSIHIQIRIQKRTNPTGKSNVTLAELWGL